MSESPPPTPPAAPVSESPPPPRRFRPGAFWWLPGLVFGVLAAGVAAAVTFRPAPPRAEVRALVNLRERGTELGRTDEQYESYRREQVFILKTRDLLTRTANDPSVISLGMMKGTDDPVRLLEENLSVSAAAPSILAVTLKGDNIDEMKVVVDALVKRYVDDATAAGRRSREDRRKKLERLEQTLKDEAEAVERQMKLLATARAGDEEIAKLNQELNPQREAIAKIRTQLVQLRLQQNLDNNENVREFARALPSPEESTPERCPMWQSAGVAFAAAFVLVTLFQLVTLAFQALRRVA